MYIVVKVSLSHSGKDSKKLTNNLHLPINISKIISCGTMKKITSFLLKPFYM